MLHDSPTFIPSAFGEVHKFHKAFDSLFVIFIFCSQSLLWTGCESHYEDFDSVPVGRRDDVTLVYKRYSCELLSVLSDGLWDRYKRWEDDSSLCVYFCLGVWVLMALTLGHCNTVAKSTQASHNWLLFYIKVWIMQWGKRWYKHVLLLLVLVSRNSAVSFIVQSALRIQWQPAGGQRVFRECFHRDKTFKHVIKVRVRVGVC